MTQAIINNLNNIEEMMQNKMSEYTSATKIYEMDSTSFDKYLSNNINKSQENSKVIKFNKTEELSVEEKNFKKILKKAKSEAVAENSLELTLNRDFNEIISQFKEFIESATEDGKIVIDEEMLKKLEAGEFDEELKILFNQIITNLNTELLNSFADVNKTSLIKDEITTFFENISDDVQLPDEITDSIAEKIINAVEEELKQDLDNIIDADILEDLNIEEIEASSDFSNGEFLMQNQTAEEQSLKAMLTQDAESFDISLNKISNTQNIQNSQTKITDISPSRILEQITKQLDTLQTNSKVNIVLNPEALGKINIQLLSTKSGLVAQFTASTAEARDLLMKGIDGLKETLLSHGVAIDNISVKLNDVQSSEYNADWTEQEGSRGGNKGDGQPAKEEKEKGLFEKMMTQINLNENGNV